MRATRLAVAAACSVLLSCAPVAANAPQSPDYVVFDASKIEPLRHQCSRSVPPPGDGSWMPADADIARFEATLPAMLAKDGAVRKELKDAPKGFGRQYVGITRGGHHMIYGNFFPRWDGDSFQDWRDRPVVVCDGGITFFGAEYDVESGSITHIAFNGYA